MKKITLFCLTCLGMVLFSCSSDKQEIPEEVKEIFDPTNKFSKQDLKGTIYWKRNTETGYLHLEKGEINPEFIAPNIREFIMDYDISWDKKEIALVKKPSLQLLIGELKSRISEPFKASRVDTLMNWIAVESNARMHIRLSPNKRYLALLAGKKLITIDLEDDLHVFHVRDDLEDTDSPVWDSDNQLYFRENRNFYRVTAEDGFDEIQSRVSLEPGSKDVVINPQADKISFSKDQFIWIMDVDGENLKQITQSDKLSSPGGGDRFPTFSADGKFLAFSSDAQRGYARGEEWVTVNDSGEGEGFLAIIPADGRVYNMDSPYSGVYWPIAEGSKALTVTDLTWR